MATLKKIKTLGLTSVNKTDLLSSYIFNGTELSEYRDDRVYSNGDRIVSIDRSTDTITILKCLNDNVTGLFNPVVWEESNFSGDLQDLNNKETEDRLEMTRQFYDSGVLQHAGYRPEGIQLPKNKGEFQVPAFPNILGYENTIILNSFKALVNGFKINVCGSNNEDHTSEINIIKLPEPPIAGSRDDLVYLEVWLEDQAKSTGLELKTKTVANWRIRVASDVNFDKYPNGFTNKNGVFDAVDMLRLPSAQGGNNTPLYDGTERSMFTKTNASTIWEKGGDPDDSGVFVTGLGNRTKDILKTSDGYVYAIPLFKVNRRNNNKYSLQNPRGAKPFKQWKTASPVLQGHRIIPLQSIEGLEVGDKIFINSKYNKLIIEDVNLLNTSITLNKATSELINTSTVIYLESDRPDGIYSNVISSRDIIDLRHLIKPNLNYDSILKKEFNRFMKRDTSKRNLMKTYHGVTKTPIDANTIFYASFDGRTKAEQGGNEISVANVKYLSMPTGSGVSVTDPNSPMTHTITPITNMDSFSIDYWFMLKGNNPDQGLYIRQNTTDILQILGVNAEGNLELGYFRNTTQVSKEITKIIPNTRYHIRVTYSREMNSITCIINGLNSITIDNTELGDWNGKLSGFDTILYKTNIEGSNGLVVADLSISNISRGLVFSSLPKDFITGDAFIGPAFTQQRKSFSAAQGVQSQSSIARINNVSDYGISINSISNTKWTIGDTIEVYGLGGEIISGLFDLDTAITPIKKDIPDGEIIVDVLDVSKLSASDTIRFYNRVENTLSQEYTIITVVPETSKLILNTPVVGKISFTENVIVETTASTSSPIINYSGGVVPGTWSGLGTNNAIFTITSLPVEFTNQDIIISYSLVTPSNESALMYLPINILEGESNGTKLVKREGVAVYDDFTDKLSGSVTINPHSTKTGSGVSLLNPSQFINEFTTEEYRFLSKKDEILLKKSSAIINEHAQILISIDIVRLIEDKYGKIPLENKIAWIEENVSNIEFNAFIMGSSPTGNSAKLAIYGNNKWNVWGSEQITDSVTPVKISSNVSNTGLRSIKNNVIDSKGFIHALVYSEVSDGVTSSDIYIDFVDVSLDFKPRSGYVMLLPERVRRNDGRASVIYIRPESKEVESLFNKTNNAGVITFMEYIPLDREILTEQVTILAESNGFIVSDLSTAVSTKQEDHHWMNPLERVGNDRDAAFGEVGFVSIPFAADAEGVNIGSKVEVHQGGFKEGFITQYAVNTLNKPFVAIASYLVEHESELKLLVYSKYTANGGIFTGYDKNLANAILIPIEGRPLVKGEDGGIIGRSFTPKAWRTISGQIQGFVDVDGVIIPTYQ